MSNVIIIAVVLNEGRIRVCCLLMIAAADCLSNDRYCGGHFQCELVYFQNTIRKHVGSRMSISRGACRCTYYRRKMGLF